MVVIVKVNVQVVFQRDAHAIRVDARCPADEVWPKYIGPDIFEEAKHSRSQIVFRRNYVAMPWPASSACSIELFLDV